MLGVALVISPPGGVNFKWQVSDTGKWRAVEWKGGGSLKL